MNEKELAAFKVVDKVCASYIGNRKDHDICREALGIIHAAMTRGTNEKEIKKEEDDG